MWKTHRRRNPDPDLAMQQWRISDGEVDSSGGVPTD